jgi:hypothetical protein
MSGPIRQRCRHQPLLLAIRSALGALRPEGGQRRLIAEYDKRRQRQCDFEQRSHRMSRAGQNKDEMRQQNTGRESNREP